MALRNLDSTKPVISNRKYGFDTINKGFFKRNDEKRSDEQYRIGLVRGLILSICLILYWEILLGVVCDGTKIDNVLYYFLSAGVIASVVSVLSCVLKNIKVNYIISVIIKMFICFIYVGQGLWYEVNGTFSNKIFSVMHMDKSDILQALTAKWWWVILMILPFVISIAIFVIFNRIDEDILGYARRTVAGYIFVILIGVLTFSLFELSVQLMDTDNNPVYSIYLETDNYNDYIDNFGLSSYVVRGIFDK